MNRSELNVLVACERSGTVRDAFLALGYNAWSCDLEADEKGSNRHIIGDVRHVLDSRWHLMVAHPVCTRLCNSGVRWLHEPPTKLRVPDYTAQEVKEYEAMNRDERHSFMWRKLTEGVALFSAVWNAPVKCKAVENPVMHGYAKRLIVNYKPFAQSVHPWQFATLQSGPDNVKKRTCWWLDNLPPLKPTGTLDGSTARPDVHYASPGPGRSAQRAFLSRYVWRMRSTVGRACASRSKGGNSRMMNTDNDLKTRIVTRLRIRDHDLAEYVVKRFNRHETPHDVWKGLFDAAHVILKECKRR